MISSPLGQATARSTKYGGFCGFGAYAAEYA